MSTDEEILEERRTAFVKKIEGYFAKDETDNARDAVDDLTNYDLFTSSGFELIPILSKYVTTRGKKEKMNTFNCAQEMLCKIAKELSPQETYLELLEQAEDEDNVKFITVLNIIKYCLFRIPKQRGKSICWVCDTITRHLCNMEIPNETESNDESDAELLQTASQLNVIFAVYEAIVEFLQPFVEEIKSGGHDLPSGHIDEYRDTVLRCLLKCLGRPLVQVNLAKDSQHYALAQSLLDMIAVLNRDPLLFLQHVDLSFGSVDTLEDDVVSTDFTNVSLGCYYYLVFDNDERLQTISHVFAPLYIFECGMALGYDMMATDETALLFKALTLFNCILDRISPKTIKINSIRNRVLSKFLEVISRSMVYHDNKEMRKLSVTIFPKLIHKFTAEGQYIIMYNANQLSTNPGFIGYIITLVKERTREALDTKDPNCLKYFTGGKLIDFMQRYCKINGLIEADLHTHTDQIMSGLNLIRYVLLRDSNNEAHLSVYLNKVDEHYLEPVKRACTFARGLYEEFKADLGKPPDDRFQLSIVSSKNVLPETNPQEQLGMMNENLTRIDMIEYLASRVSQCLVEYKQKNCIEIAC